jgi:L-fuconolactonase
VRIDAHQHFWSIARGDYGWLSEASGTIYRDFLPPDLAPLLAGSRIERTILVQAAPTVAETRFLLDLARQTPFVGGVVGWVDFAARDAAAQVAELARDPLLVGLRPMVQDIADDDWLVRDDLASAFAALIDHDLVFDALVLPRHLSGLLVVLDRHPNLAVVVDHAAKPDIAAARYDPWRVDLAAVAARPNTTCKLSGLVSQAGPGWSPAQLRPVVDHIVECFDPTRLLWGSDWPVSTAAATYQGWLEAAVTLTKNLGVNDRTAIFGGTATRVYLSKRGR